MSAHRSSPQATQAGRWLISAVNEADTVTKEIQFVFQRVPGAGAGPTEYGGKAGAMEIRNPKSEIRNKFKTLNSRFLFETLAF